MSYKLVRNALGNVVCFGPNDDNYEPTVPPGGFLEISPEPPPPSSDELITQFTAAIQTRLDTFAQSRGYDNAAATAKYANITDVEIAALPLGDQAQVTCYRNECRHALLKVAQTWASAERILAQVQAGTRPIPASLTDIEADLPPLVWPV